MNLRHLFISFIILGFSYGCKSSEKSDKTYIINVQADGVYDGIRAYLNRNENGKNVTATDTAIAINGSFLFKGDFEAHEMRSLSIDGIRGQAFFVLESGETNIVAYKDSIQQSKVTGGYNNDAFNAYKSGYERITNKLNGLRKEFSAARENPELMKQLQSQNNALREEMKNYGFTFLKEYPNSDFSLMLLELVTAQKSFDVAAAKDVLALMSEELLSKPSNSNKVLKIQQKIDAAEAVSSIAIGALAPDFTAPNPEGKSITMNAIKGKITIIDFWASWCRPCRVENPTYVRLYEEYHDKGLEIISVSLDRQNQKQRWIDAIEKDKLTWYNVSNLKFWNDPVAKLYNITSIPAAFIIDEQGVIIAERLRGPALEAKIAELLD